MGVIRSKRRTLALQITVEGELIVRAPRRLSSSFIDQFIQEKEPWIIHTRQRLRQKYSAIRPPQFVEGELFWYLGTTYPLRIIPKANESLILTDCFELVASAVAAAQTVFTAWYKREAIHIIEERVHHFASCFQFEYGKIRLSNAGRRWGSCSAKNDLNFTWKLIMAPLIAIDYVVVHELVHTQHKNHGVRFWIEVEKILPDYISGKKWLRKQEHLLVWN